MSTLFEFEMAPMSPSNFYGRFGAYNVCLDPYMASNIHGFIMFEDKVALSDVCALMGASCASIAPYGGSWYDAISEFGA